MASCQKAYQDSAPIINTCPADTDIVLFSQADGTQVFRLWATVIQCLAGNSKIKAIAGGGGEDDPIPNTTVYENTKLIGLGVNNSGRISIIVNGSILQNWGVNTAFSFDPNTGIITGLNPWVGDGSNANSDSLEIDLNQ